MAAATRNSVALTSANPGGSPASVAFAFPGRPQGGYLVAYLQQLQTHPLRTKMITSGTLQAVQEYLASYLTGMKNKNGGYFTDRVIKMSLYGTFVQAPMNHKLVEILQKLFAGRTGPGAKALQIIVNNLTVLPIQIVFLVAYQAYVRGANTLDEVKAAVKVSFPAVYKFASVSSPISLLFAQNFLPAELWVPWFNVVQFILGTTFNVIAKRKAQKLAEVKKEAEAKKD